MNLHQRLTYLSELIITLTSSPVPTQQFQALADHLPTLLPCDYLGLCLLSPDAPGYLVHSLLGEASGFIPYRLFALDEGAVGQMLGRNRTLHVSNLADFPQATADFEQILLRFGMQTAVCLPLRQGEKPLGALFIAASEHGSYGEDEIQIGRLLGAGVSAALENARLYQELIDERRTLAALLQSSQDAVLMLNEAGVVLLANPAVKQMLHLEPDLLTGQRLEEMVAYPALQQLFAAQRPDLVELAIPNGRFAHLASSNFTRRDDLQGIGLADLQDAMLPDDQWIVGESQFVAHKQGHKETIFTIGNGYFASRGSFEEGYPGESALTFAHGVYNDAPVFFTELANLPNWLDLQITINRERFRLDSGKLLSFRRWLNLADGILHRQLRWQSPSGVVVDLGFERFVAYTEQHVGGIRMVATAVNQPCTLAISAGINGHVANEHLLHWHLLDQGQAENGVAWLHSQTRHTKIELGTAMRVETAVSAPTHCQNCLGHPLLTVEQMLQPGETLQLDKLVSYVTSRDVAGSDVVETAVSQFTNHTYNTLRQDHTVAWQKLWQDIDVIIEGDQEAQLATRFSLFQLQVAAPRYDNRVSIGAKTLSGLGYRGHVFWDTEIFVLPFFTYTQPAVARNLLHYRYHTLAGARRKAAGNGYGG
ncbi:MAG: GAF domain-containing protein, partial [Anaerolineales bacterium]|nr:GAF domain-containing protein [Anaerolineales bacterium]